MGEDQRRFVRKNLRVEFRAKDTEGTGELLFEALDLSTGGTFLASELLLEQGEGLSVEFRIPSSPKPVRAQARVAWVRRFPRQGEQAGMGIEFLAMSDQDREILSQYLGGAVGR